MTRSTHTSYYYTLNLSVLTNTRSTMNYYQPRKEMSRGIPRVLSLLLLMNSKMQMNMWKLDLEKDFWHGYFDSVI